MDSMTEIALWLIEQENKKMILTRVNAMGMTYHLTPAPGDNSKTRVCFGNKFIHVNMTLDQMSACWYQWTIKNKYVQDAFPMLSASEREFLMTGITETEWKQIFAESNEQQNS